MEKVGKEFWSLDQNKFSFVFFYLLILFLPTQLGKHFFPPFSFAYGLRIDYLSPTLYLTDVLILLIFIFSAKDVLTILIRRYKKILLYFLLFIIFLLTGVMVSKNPQVGVLGIFKIVEYVFLGTFFYLNFNKLNKKILSILLFTGIFFESILSLVQYLNKGSFQGLLYFLGERSFNQQTPGIANASINNELILRPYATFSHPNILAGYLLLSTVFLLSFKNTINKYLIKIILIITTVGIFISFSRIVIIAWLLFIVVYFLISIGKKYKNPKLNTSFLGKELVISLVLIIFLLTMFSNTILIERFTLFSFSDESIVQRLSLTSSSINMIIKNPVFGVGVNNFLNNLEPSFNSPLLIQPVHNIFLLALSQVGIVGFIVFMYLFIKSFVRTFTLKDNKFIKISLLFSICFIGLFDHYFLTIQQGQILFTIIISYLLLKPLKN
ncbi:MAG: O-antigen ligase family protein [Patescibacteria group bacterium]